MLISLFVSAAFALPQYPFEVEDALEMTCAPQCVLCHASAAGGSGTVVQPFGVAMMERGLSASGGLIEALDAMREDEIDSDGDGTIDVDELAAGEDPNLEDEAFCAVAGPEYGCFSHAPVPVGLAGLGLALGAVAARRKGAAQRIVSTS